MWQSIQENISQSIYSANSYALLLCETAVSGTVPTPQFNVKLSTAKGLIFVLLYGIYEYTVRESFRAALSEIKNRPASYSKLRLELLSLIMDDGFKSVNDCGPKRKWVTRIEFIRKAHSDENIFVSDDLFPHDGSHFRIEQLETIWHLLGINSPILPSLRLQPLISEIVEHRNAIAHGRLSPNDIGRRYSAELINEKIRNIQEVCMHIVSTIEQHCINPNSCVR